jgi:hypothetical protein
MMPPSRRAREHCRPMKKINIVLKERGIPYRIIIDKYYKNIFSLMTQGNNPSKVTNKKLNHPKGKTCGWDRSTPRYWWVNFIPALFNIKGIDNYTIEVRNMHASLDFNVIKNWVLLNMAIVSFVENNISLIKEMESISLSDIINKEFKGKRQYMLDYIEERKNLFKGISTSEESFIYNPKNNITKRIEGLNTKKVVMT